MKKYSYMIVALLLSATSCSDGNDEIQTTPEEPEITLEDGTAEHVFGSAGGQQNISFTTNMEWTAKSSSSWCRATPSSGEAGERTITLIVKKNDTYEERSTTVTLQAGTAAKQITVTQVQNNAILVAKQSYEVEAEGGELNFSINTNVDFEMELSADWLRTNQSRALEEVPLSFVIEANESKEPREATITLTADNVEQTIHIIQKGIQDPNTVIIMHNNSLYTAPVLSGMYMSDVYISWGDGNEEEYKEGITHRYEKEGERTVIINSKGAEEITLQNLVGVTSIDLSGF